MMRAHPAPADTVCPNQEPTALLRGGLPDNARFDPEPVMRTLLLALLAAVIGALAAVQIVGALRQRDAYPRGVMDVMAVHAGTLDHAVRTRRCTAETTAQDLAMLVTMSGEIPHAFPDLMQDRQFAKFAQAAHAFDQQIAANPPRDCPALDKAMAQIGEHCDQCHRIYR
jgi:cytochrome c556